MDEGFFTYRPAIWNPPQENYCETRQTGVVAVSPPTRNARPLQGGPGIFACGCQGGITHYTLPPRGAARRAPGDTPGPRFAASAALETGLDWLAACAPLPLFLPPFTRVGGVPLLGGKNAPAGGRRTKDGGYCRDENSACDSSQTLLKYTYTDSRNRGWHPTSRS